MPQPQQSNFHSNPVGLGFQRGRPLDFSARTSMVSYGSSFTPSKPHFVPQSDFLPLKPSVMSVRRSVSPSVHLSVSPPQVIQRSMHCLVCPSLCPINPLVLPLFKSSACPYASHDVLCSVHPSVLPSVRLFVSSSVYPRLLSPVKRHCAPSVPPPIRLLVRVACRLSVLPSLRPRLKSSVRPSIRLSIGRVRLSVRSRLKSFVI